MFEHLCKNNSCINQSQQKYQVQVSPFFQVQQGINQLPPFQYQYHQHPPSHTDTSTRKSNTSHSQSGADLLKRVKSEPQCRMMTPSCNEKENGRESQATEYSITPKIMKQQSAPRPQIRILYDSNHNNQKQVLKKDLFPSNTNTNIIQKTNSYVQKQQLPLIHHSQIPQNQKNEEKFVSVEQFNKMVQMNMNLIKMLEQEHKPIKNTVYHLQEEQQQRTKLIEMLEDRVRNLKQQMCEGKTKTVYQRLY